MLRCDTYLRIIFERFDEICNLSHVFRMIEFIVKTNNNVEKIIQR